MSANVFNFSVDDDERGSITGEAQTKSYKVSISFSIWRCCPWRSSARCVTSSEKRVRSDQKSNYLARVFEDFSWILYTAIHLHQYDGLHSTCLKQHCGTSIFLYTSTIQVTKFHLVEHVLGWKTLTSAVCHKTSVC